MIYYLGHPLTFLFLIGSFVVASALHVEARRAVLAFGARKVPKWARTQRQRLSAKGWLASRHWLDPYGSVAALITGIGWAPPIEPPAFRGPHGRYTGAAAAGPLANIVVGLGCYAGLSAGLGASAAEFGIGATYLDTGLAAGALSTFAFVCLATGVIGLIPIPPMEAGRLLFLYGPRSRGWATAQYQLSERNFGLLALFVLMIIPPGGPVLQYLVYLIGSHLTALVS